MQLGPWFEKLFHYIPLSLLEVWGSFGFIVGLILMVFAFGGFTFRTGHKWSLGREWQAWDEKSFLSMGITFVLIWISGFIGSFYVLVPGAQTFESLKDLAVFLCVVLFGYPALITVPLAYGLSDFYEGIPLDFMSDWWIGYFINPSCYWLAHQLIGKCPDFKKLRTWGLYFGFVISFMFIEPILWGYICSGKFTTEESYYIITPALFYTTFITWCFAPFAMLAAYPIVRRLGYFWADIPGHVKQKKCRGSEWVWSSGEQYETDIESKTDSDAGVPIRLFILAPFVVTALFIMGTTAYFTLKSSQDTATRHAERFHAEISEKINMKLSDYFKSHSPFKQSTRVPLEQILENEPALVFIIDKAGKLISSSRELQSREIVGKAISTLQTQFSDRILQSNFNFQYRVDVHSVRTLTQESWLFQAMPIPQKENFILMTAMPESFYLAGVREGQSRSSLVFAFGLVLVLVVVGILGAMVISPIRKVCHAAHALSQGDLSLRIPKSRLAEMNTLSTAFNSMADSLQNSFQQIALKENRLSLAVQTGNLGIWEWDIHSNKILWNDLMFIHYNMETQSSLDYESWTRKIVPEDFKRVKQALQAALRGEKEFDIEFRVRWQDGTTHILHSHAKTLRDEFGIPFKMTGINYDITESRMAEKELMFYRNQLEEVVDRRTKDLMRQTAELQKLTEKQSKAEIYEKIAQIFLSMRNYTNSPLQAQTLSIELLKIRCPDQKSIIESLDDSVRRLASINMILRRLESTFTSTKLLNEEEILDYLDKIEQLS